MTRRLTHIDCFSGPGGICTGFRAAGFETLLAIELVESCVETYTANHKDVPVINKDIRDVTEEEVKRIVGNRVVDILTAGMPCETFSTAGATSRSFYDHRQFLYREAIRLADAVNARMILFENVPGIQTKKVAKDSDRLIIDEIYDDLAKYGYVHHISAILNAEDFGVPQSRERFFILASREKLDLRVPVAKNRKVVTVEEAFIDLPEEPKETINSAKKKLENGEEIEVEQYKEIDSAYSKLMKDRDFWKFEKKELALTYHFAPVHRKGTIKRFEMIKQGEGLKDLFDKLMAEHGPEEIERLQKEKILPNKWYIQRNRRLSPDKPSVTVTSHCLSELLHPIKNRALTVREVARLQSFPDFYDFKGGKFVAPHKDPQQDKYEQIGDAVPPLLAYHWGLVIKEILEGVRVPEGV
jgi:DNA (cytosine-5)-methyltransferase 1